MSSVCSACRSEVSAGFAFCPRCGHRLPSACPACGFACEPDFAFCPRCGAARTQGGATPVAAAQSADRRQVTVIFADLSGFTALAERLDPEEVRAFQSALFEALAR